MTLRVVPQSLFGRLLLALLVTVTVTLAVVAALVVREWPEVLLAASGTDVTVSRIAADVDLLFDAAPAERAERAERMRVERRPVARASSAAQVDEEVTEGELVEVAAELQGLLQRELGQDYAIAVTPLPSRVISPPEDPTGRRYRIPAFLNIVVTRPNGDVVTLRENVPPLQEEVPPLAPQWPIALLSQVLLVTLVLGAVLYWTVLTITRPLRELEAAAETVGLGARSAPLSESGVQELRSTTRAFNSMQERLYRYLDSRALVLAAMSHDLRTPLTRLKLRMEALDDEELRARCNSDLDEMERLITGALKLFKGVDQEVPLESVRVEELLAPLSRELAELGWDVAVSGSTGAPINAREDSLRRCLINLISNAVKYGKSASVSVVDEAGDVVVRVQDEGPGIPEAMLERVFEPFFRLDDSRNIDTGGTGLGLSIARDVAQAHGGSLVLRNRSPRGLEAILRFPRSAAH